MERDSGSHKGQNGKVAVVGGSRDFTGAPALAARASLRAGADLVKIVASEEVSEVVASYSENLIVGEYSGGYLTSSDVPDILELFDWAEAAVVGPGLSRPEEEAVREILEHDGVLKVVDADAIEPALGANLSDAVLTPHRGERRMIESQFGSVENYVEETGNTVLAKREADVITSPDGREEVEAGHPGMTVGGTGDVLAGAVAGLLARGLEPAEAAKKAAEANGRAGQKAAEEYGNGLLATDLIDGIPKFI